MEEKNNFYEEDIIILCPYCISEITEETTICEHCGSDTGIDSPFEMILEEFQELEMKSCNYCKHSIPKLAVICRNCKKKLK
jgi:hypothetical protein